MQKFNLVTKKNIYILLLCIIPLINFVIKPTLSKFTESIITDQDIVNINTNLNLNLSNVTEFKTIKVGSKDYEVFDIELENNTTTISYYNIWYKLLTNITNKEDITIAKLNISENETKGKLDIYETKKITIIVRNNTNSQIKLNIGSSKSTTSIDDIPKEKDKEFIEKEDIETDIYYDRITDKYYFSKTNTEVEFKVEPVNFQYSKNYQTFTAPYSGYYQMELWSPSTLIQNGDYLSTNLYLKQNQSIYFYVGSSLSKDIYAETDVRLVPGNWDNETSLKSRVLIAGNDINPSYIYGYEDEQNQQSTPEEAEQSTQETVEKEEETTISQETNETKENQDLNQDNSEITEEKQEDTELPKQPDIKPLYELDNITKYNFKKPKNNLLIYKNHPGNGIASINYISHQEPSIIGIKTITRGQNYDIKDIVCKDNGRGCNLIKVSPKNTSNLSTGKYEIVYIASDNDGITYKFSQIFEVID